LLKKVEFYSKFLLVLSTNNQEIKGEIQELSYKISTLKEELADETPFSTICGVLEIIHEMLKGLFWFFEGLSYAFLPYFYFCSFLALICLGIVRIIKFNIFFIGNLLSCWEWPGPPTGTLIVKVLDTQGGLPQNNVYVEIRNGTYGILTKTHINGKAYFFFLNYKDWDVYVNNILAGIVEFYQPKLDVVYYLDELQILKPEFGI
jgi:hypothetical protein